MLNRTLICAVMAMALLSYGLWQKARLEKTRRVHAQELADARQNAISALTQMQKNYERRLRQQSAARQRIERARTRAIIQIEKGKTDGPEDYRRWAGQRLPDVVIERLRRLPEERTAGDALPDATP